MLSPTQCLLRSPWIMLQQLNGAGLVMDSEKTTASNPGTTSFSGLNNQGIVPSQTARIAVIGVGGGGSNAINRMIASELEGVGFAVLNTDAQALSDIESRTVLQLGNSITKGLGAGANPEVGRGDAFSN